MRTMRAISVVVAAMVGTSSTASGQTLIDNARRMAPEPYLHQRMCDCVTVWPPEYVRGADAIMFATVVRGASTMSADQKSITTDFTIAPIRILYQKPLPPEQPGRARPLTLRRDGGEMVIEGLRIKSSWRNELELRPGVPFLFFLTELDRAQAVYKLMNPLTGAIALIDGRLDPNTDMFRAEWWTGFKSLTMDEVDQEIKRLRHVTTPPSAIE